MGIYIPEWFFRATLPDICVKDRLNPDRVIGEALLNSEVYQRELRAVYYNGKHLGKNTRDEYRITRWGGRSSPIQDPESTGALFIIALGFGRDSKSYLVGWVAQSVEEEATIESWIGTEVLPQEFYGPGHLQLTIPKQESAFDRIPTLWQTSFPSGAEIFAFVEQELPYGRNTDIDRLLVRRRGLEFDVFKEVERRHLEPQIKVGFTSVDEFVSLANSVTNRRKARTGSSLELNLESLFRSECIVFERGAKTELQKRPDFMFPSSGAYHDPQFNESGLHMLGAKTCCKDRWRQVADEAERIRRKHLFTLQEGVSENQLSQMDAAGISLVVPAGNKTSFPVNVRPKLLSLKDFVETVRYTQQRYPPR